MAADLHARLESYLSALYRSEVKIHSVQEIGKKGTADLKSFGYGKPLRIQFYDQGELKTVVLETMSENSFGHDHFSDRAQSLLWQHSAFNQLPEHVHSIDVGAFTSGKEMLSLGKAEEFFILTDYVSGTEYASDLARIHQTGKLEPLDEARASALSRYLTQIHAVKKNAPHLYKRRIRDLIGHGECIMGLIDNYPPEDPVMTPARLQRIEKLCCNWRWRLKDLAKRLTLVHGDYHPWNILFREGTDFTVLDRSRGEWGEPADDLSAMMINYVFLSLRLHGKLAGPFETLYRIFWETYLKSTGDMELLQVIPPFIAWRCLVLNNPVWYPSLPLPIRENLASFTENVLALNQFLPEHINEYLL